MKIIPSNKLITTKPSIPKKVKLDYFPQVDDALQLDSMIQDDRKLSSVLKPDQSVKKKIKRCDKSGKTSKKISRLNFRFKEAEKSAVYQESKITHFSNSDTSLNNNINAGFTHNGVTPKSKTPALLVTPKGKTELHRKLVIKGFDNKGIAIYTKTPCENNELNNQLQTPKRKIQQVNDEQSTLFFENTPVKKIKKTVSHRTKLNFLKQKFIPNNQKHGSKRKISQNQVMGESAKSAAIEYISGKTKPNKLIETALKKKLRIEWRHLKPYSVGGLASQTKENLAAGTAYSNTIELCIEEAVEKIRDTGTKLEIEVRESIFQGNVGKNRTYVITNTDNLKEVKLIFSAWEINQPYTIYREILYNYICRQLDALK